MSKPKLTDWFPTDIKPVNVGVYQTDTGNGEEGFQYWNGVNWRFWGFNVNDAFRCRHDKSGFQKVKWRGRANNPKRKK